MKRNTINNWYEVKNQSDTPELLIYGYIGPWDEVDFVSFQAAIKNLSKSYNALIVRIHSGGGSVIDGLPIYDALVTSGMTITVIIDGMAASMAGVLSQAASLGLRGIHENGTIMIHRVKGSEYGNSDELRAYADMVEEREKRIKAIFVKTTNQSAETVDAWFAKNTDWWINAEEALKLGLVDYIIKGDSTATKLPFNKLQNMSEKAAYDALKNSLPVTTNKSQKLDMNKLQILIMAALAARGVSVAENATEEQAAAAVTAAFKTVDEKVQNLEQKLKDKDTERADALVNSLVAAGKIKADDEEGKKEIKELALVNYAMAVKMGDKMAGTVTPPKNVVVNITTLDENGKKQINASQDRENWTLVDYQKNDPKALSEMETKNPDLFNKLVSDLRNSLKEKGAIA